MTPPIIDLDIEPDTRAPAPLAPPTPPPAPFVELDLPEDIDGEPTAPLVNTESVPVMLAMASQLHDAGHLREAEPILRGILRAVPDHVEAMHRLGVVHHALGNRERAVALLGEAARLESGDPSLWRHLGEALRATRRLDEAEACFGFALRLVPDDADALYDLGHVHAQQGRLGDAVHRYHEALTYLPDDPAILTSLGTVLSHLGRRRDALLCLERAHRIDPHDATTLHFLAALRREGATSSPRDYIAALFDSYAETFDDHLVEDLGYDAPALLRRAVDTVAGPVAASWRVADLGCGTGLCGETFRSTAATLIGVDLSPEMIRRARRRNLYDVLLCDDIGAALEPEIGTLDLVVAGDVFPYVGGLEGMFELAARALRPHGLIAFTTERGKGDEVTLGSSGRFVHGEGYVRHVSSAHRFDEERVEEVTVRRDGGRWISGHLFVLRRSG
ncbi:MAG: tetratricopeptide repeat protein [Planctomycetes bacterium]|nr:tetratricopeptide repeat protein [Planctomycetota bacterium]